MGQWLLARHHPAQLDRLLEPLVHDLVEGVTSTFVDARLCPLVDVG
jgi:hypothetical protein